MFLENSLFSEMFHSNMLLKYTLSKISALFLLRSAMQDGRVPIVNVNIINYFILCVHQQSSTYSRMEGVLLFAALVMSCHYKARN